MTNLHQIQFQDLVKRHGQRPALELVRTIEKLALLHNDVVVPLDQEVRFRKAIDALTKISFAA